MSSSLKNKVEEDTDSYSSYVEKITEYFNGYEENSVISVIDLKAIFKKVNQPFHEYLLFKKEDKQLVRETMERINDEELEIDQALFLLTLKRAFIIDCMKEDINYLFQCLSNGTEEITKKSFVTALESLPPLKANQKVIQTMINMADGFPIARPNFEKLLVIIEFVDQRVDAFDSILKKKSHGRKRTKSEKK